MARKTLRTWCGRQPGHSLTIAGRTADSYFRVSDNPDPNEQKSVDKQRDLRNDWLPGAAVIKGRDYVDDDRSASAMQTREREQFAQLRADIDAGRLDGHILWCYTTSRLSRGDIPLDVFGQQCADHGIVWCINGRVLNPANSQDRQGTRVNHMMDVNYSEMLAEAVLDGKERAARQGLPAVGALYGYRRLYQTTPDGQPYLIKGRPVILGDEPAEPAASVVREIFTRLESGDTLSRIRADLEDRRIPAPRHPRKCTSCGYVFKKDDNHQCPYGHVQDLCQWHTSAVRFIATNISYLGLRIYQAESASLADRRRAVLTGPDGKPIPAKWPALIGEEQFWAVQHILADASRSRWRSPNRANADSDSARRAPFLLVPAARCAECGAALGGHAEAGGKWYRCRIRGCVSIRADWLEGYAESRLVTWLALPETRSRVWGDKEDADTQASEARAKLARYHVELAEARAKGEDLDEDAEYWSRRAKVLRNAIDTEQAKLQPAELPALDMMGRDAAKKWVALKQDAPHAARQLMASVAQIYVHPGKRGGANRVLDRSRIEWHWQIGTDASTGPTREGCTERLNARKTRLEESRAAAEDLLRADPSVADAEIGRKTDLAYGTVKRIRAKLEAAGEITDPGYRMGVDGKRYFSSGNGRPGSPRVNRSEGTARRPAHVEEKRARIRAALAEHPAWSHTRIGRELGGIAHDTVASVCTETGGECRHGLTGQGSRRNETR